MSEGVKLYLVEAIPVGGVPLPILAGVFVIGPPCGGGILLGAAGDSLGSKREIGFSLKASQSAPKLISEGKQQHLSRALDPSALTLPPPRALSHGSASRNLAISARLLHPLPTQSKLEQPVILSAPANLPSSLQPHFPPLRLQPENAFQHRQEV